MFAWLADQYTAHLYAVGIIRAMPETEIPPLCGVFIMPFLRGSRQYVKNMFICKIKVIWALKNAFWVGTGTLHAYWWWKAKMFLSWDVEISRLFLCIFNKNIVLFTNSRLRYKWCCGNLNLPQHNAKKTLKKISAFCTKKRKTSAL